MYPRTTASSRDRQKRLQNDPLLVRQVARISLVAPVITPTVIFRPNHRTACQQIFARYHLPKPSRHYYGRLSQQTLSQSSLAIDELNQVSSALRSGVSRFKLE
jgi:hypothetical protein